MAYTYDNFVSEANAAGLMNQFSEQDLRTAQKNPEYGMSLLGLLKDNSNASTEEQRLLATEAANQLRKSYGVSGAGMTGTRNKYAANNVSGVDGLMDQVNNYGSFDYEGQDAYQKLLESIVNQQPFSYDPQADPSWGAYRKAYMREGDRASANALAQASAASGGRPSSYAMTAAQQAGNYYAGQLVDMLPNLQQDAYNRYLSDFNSRLSGLGALQSDREFDYQNWMNEYNMLQNSLGNYQNQEQLDFENALALYQALGYATPEVAEILGIGSGDGSGSNGGTGGSSGGGKTGYSNGSLSAEQVRELQAVLGVDADGKYGPASKSAAGGLSAEEAYAKYVAGGSGQSGDLYSGMMDELQDLDGAGEVDTSGFTVTNRNGNGWIAIGNGRMTWTELEQAVNQGTVVEVIDPEKGTITYKYASTGNKSNKNSDNSGKGGGGTSRVPPIGGKVDSNIHAAVFD